MAVKWLGEIKCAWCGKNAKAGIEKDGLGRTYRVICPGCGISSQSGFDYPSGRMIAKALSNRSEHSEIPIRSLGERLRGS